MKQQYELQYRQDHTYPFYKFQYHQTLLYRPSTYHHKPGWCSCFRRHRAHPYNFIFLYVRRSNIVGYVGGRMIHISMCNTCKTSMTLPPTTSAYGKRIFVDIVHIRIIFNQFRMSTSIFISSEIILRGYSKINMKMNFWENIE